MSEPIISIKNVSKEFPGVKALTDVSLDIYLGKIHVLIGENGAGMSTLIKILAGEYSIAPFGRQLMAVGSNEHVAYLSGVNVDGVKIRIYIISAFMAALGGIILASKLGTGQPPAAEGYELDAIAAVVLGGTKAAGAGCAATKDMVSGYGRSRKLGEKALGIPDPGAVSVAILFDAMDEYISGGQGQAKQD